MVPVSRKEDNYNFYKTRPFELYVFIYFLEFMLQTLIGLKFTAVVFSILLWFREVRFYFNFNSNKRFLCCSRRSFYSDDFFIVVLISMHFHYAQIKYSMLAAFINLSDPRTIKNAVEANAMFIQIKAWIFFYSFNGPSQTNLYSYCLVICSILHWVKN